MAQYRKKPVVIEAFKYGVDPRPTWFDDEVTKDNIKTFSTDNILDEKLFCMIRTLEGQMRGDFGDFIIQGINGEIYPCKPDIFEKTYEKVN